MRASGAHARAVARAVHGVMLVGLAHTHTHRHTNTSTNTHTHTHTTQITHTHARTHTHTHTHARARAHTHTHQASRRVTNRYAARRCPTPTSWPRPTPAMRHGFRVPAPVPPTPFPAARSRAASKASPEASVGQDTAHAYPHAGVLLTPLRLRRRSAGKGERGDTGDRGRAGKGEVLRRKSGALEAGRVERWRRWLLRLRLFPLL